MKNFHEIQKAIKHLCAARDAAERACAPVKPGTMLNADDAKRRALYDEDFRKVIILNRMIDALQWAAGQPAELSEWIAGMEKTERIAQIGFAGRLT